MYKKGKLLIPSFSVGRTQEIVYVLNQLYNDGRLERVPVYVDSPLSANATDIFRRHAHTLNEQVRDTMRFDDDPFGFNTLRYITDVQQSKALNRSEQPCIIISSSGISMDAQRNANCSSLMERIISPFVFIFFSATSS